MKSLAARSNEIQQDLDAMFQQVHDMLGRVENALRQNPQEFNHEELHRFLVERVRNVDSLDVQIEQRCLTFLALQQPVALDLRKIMAISRIIVDLDRIADNCVNIAERLRALSVRNPLEIPQLVLVMAGVANDMFNRVIAAFGDSDASAAEDIRAEDEIIDNLQRDSIDEIINQVNQGKWDADTMLNLFSIARQLERIADHASGISEEIIFLAEGRIVRHDSTTREH